MIRTQIQLTEEQAERLRRMAARRHASMAALIREAIDSMVDGTTPEDRWQRARASVGRFASGKGDISEEHDRYLAEP